MRISMQALRPVVATVLMIVSAYLAACAPLPIVHSTVTAFHTLPANTSGTTYAFVPLPGQQADLEYATYRDEIATDLTSHGWAQASPDKAQLLVTFAYAIDQGKMATVNMPVWGETGIAGATTTGTYGYGTYTATTTYTPTYGITGSVPIQYTQYSRVLRVEIANRAPTPGGAPQRVYQADVVSVGRSDTLAPVMPAMIKALFANFPGASGQTRHETGTLQ